MTLNDYMELNKIKALHLASEAQIAPAIITRFLRGERGLSPVTAEKISHATNGRVSIQELLFPRGIQFGKAKMSSHRCNNGNAISET